MALQEWLSSATKVRNEAQKEYDTAQAAKAAAEAAVQREKDAREAYQAAKSATKGAAKLLASPPPLARSCHLLVTVTGQPCDWFTAGSRSP